MRAAGELAERGGGGGQVVKLCFQFHFIHTTRTHTHTLVHSVRFSRISSIRPAKFDFLI